MMSVASSEGLAQIKHTLESLTELLALVKWAIGIGSGAFGILMFWLRRVIRKEAEKAVIESTAKIETSLFNIRKRMVKNSVDSIDKIKQIGDSLNALGAKISNTMESGQAVSAESSRKYENAIAAFREILKRSELSRQKDLAEFQKIIVDRYKTHDE